MHKWLRLSIAVVLLDQVSKYLVNEQLILHQPIALMPQLNLTLIYNEGASFGFLSDAGGWQRWFFVVLAVLVSGYLYLWLRRLTAEAVVIAVGIALIIGGALGNVIDRIIHGHVIDFIDIYYGIYHWPAFNFADSAITLGAVIVITKALFGEKEAV